MRLDRERIAQSSEAELSELSLQVLAALRVNARLTSVQLAAITGANRNVTSTATAVGNSASFYVSKPSQ